MAARAFARTVVLLCLTLSASLLVHPAGAADSFSVGDVLVGVGSNTVQWRLPGGTLKGSLTTATSSSITTGMAFDGALATGKLYVTGYTSNVVNRFTTFGGADGTFGGGFNSHPESITFDRAGNAYVGQERGARRIVKFNSAGVQVASYAAAVEGSKGTDRIDLAGDQCTIYYTSQGKSIRRFNTCTGAQGPHVTSSLPGKEAFDVKLLPNSDQMLVADTTAIYRVNGTGDRLQTYDQPNRNCWVALALDQTAASFWAADTCASQVYRFDTGTGALLSSFATGTKAGSINGLAVFGGATAARSPSNSGYIPPEGGTITTATPRCPSTGDPACGSATFPAGPGGFASIAEVGKIGSCSLSNCIGPAFELVPAGGYVDPSNPIELELVYDQSVARGDGTSYSVWVEKLVGGIPVTTVVPSCQPLGHAVPAPCVNSITRDEGRDLHAVILALSEDPKFQLFGG
jgi:hypothetical protein